jgi:protein-S-isoprenylcysteine O-methyltransferase Ste14
VQTDQGVEKAVRTYTRKAVVSVLVMAGALFGSAGRLDWTAAWFLVAVHITTQALSIRFLDRTALEDRTLHTELGGYADYAGRVPSRLLPRLW